MNISFDIAGRQVGSGAPAYLVAEVAQAHDGSLGMAHAFVDAAAEAGADAVKFQTHIAAAESTRDERFRIKFSRQDETRYDYWRRMEFTPAQWAGLAEHARERGIHFLSTPFSVEAVELLRGLGAPAWKVASGEVLSDTLLQAICADGRPILVSTGMSGWSDIDRAVAAIRKSGVPLAVLQCTSRYPTEMAQVGLNVIGEIAARYGCPAGLSDHSGVPWPALAAVARGAAVIELHITLSRRNFGPDVPASLTVEEFRTVADFRDALAMMDTHPVDKDIAAADLSDMRGLFGRSLAPVSDLPAGTVLMRSMLTGKKPGTGIPLTQAGELVGRTLVRPVRADRLMSWEDL